MKCTKLLLVVLCVISLQELYAHALWVSTERSGIKGTAHEVKVFFAEPGEKWEPLDGDEWKLVKGFELWLVNPNGKRLRLDLSPKQDHYAASFIPQEDGLYHVELIHEHIGVLSFEGMPPFIPYFYAFAPINVGNDSTLNGNENALQTRIIPQWDEQSKMVSFDITTKNGSKGRVTLVTPDGEVKQLGEVNPGKLEFEANDTGSYQVELSVRTDGGGSYEGKEYKTAFYTATTVFTIP